MKIGFTIFKSIFDNKTHRKGEFETWDQFVECLYNLHGKLGYKPKRDEKRNGSPLISPAIYKPDSTRANANVTHWAGWAALDIDDYSGDAETVVNSFSNCKCVVYNSASSRIEHPKFRVVLALDRYVEAHQIKHLWYALNKRYNELGDPQTKDLSRMYYVPAQYPQAHSFFHVFDGEEICVDEILASVEYVENSFKSNSFKSQLSEELKQKLVEYQRSRLNRHITWSSYADCPFVNKKAVAEYRALTGGWYHKMYLILCSTAANALKRGYDINAHDLETLAKQLDTDTGGWYKTRDLYTESQRALSWAVESVLI